MREKFKTIIVDTPNDTDLVERQLYSGYKLITIVVPHHHPYVQVGYVYWFEDIWEKDDDGIDDTNPYED